MNPWLRNALLGAVFCSYRAVFAGDWLVLAVLAIAGAAAGLLYTLLEPAVRARPRLRYLPWVLCTYLVIFGGGGVGSLLVHDQDSIDMIRNPWFMTPQTSGRSRDGV